MPQFFVVTEDRNLQNLVAYAEPIKPRYEAVPLKCPWCDAIIANPRCLPPYDIRLKKPNALADIIPTFGGPELLVSGPLARAMYGLKGVEQVSSVRSIRMGTKKSNIPPPELFNVGVVHSHVRVDFDSCGTTWTSEPEDGCCRYCGPGGGGPKGCFWSFDRIVLDLSQWDGEEIFYPINLTGTLIVTEDALHKANFRDFRNVSVTSIEQYSDSYGSNMGGLAYLDFAAFHRKK